MGKIKNLDYRIQKILPLLYDDTISYEELLYSITNKMNEIIDFANGELNQAIIDYINQQFNNMFINAAYDSDTETIRLYLDEKNGGINYGRF